MPFKELLCRAWLSISEQTFGLPALHWLATSPASLYPPLYPLCTPLSPYSFSFSFSIYGLTDSQDEDIKSRSTQTCASPSTPATPLASSSYWLRLNWLLRVWQCGVGGVAAGSTCVCKSYSIFCLRSVTSYATKRAPPLLPTPPWPCCSCCSCTYIWLHLPPCTPTTLANSANSLNFARVVCQKFLLNFCNLIIAEGGGTGGRGKVKRLE